VWERVGPVCGVLAAATFVVAQALSPLRGLGVRPEDPADQISAAMSERLQGSTEFGLFGVMMLFFVSVFFLLWFLGDLHHRLQARADERSRWVATVFLAGGLALVAALLIQGFVGLVQITIVDFGDDAQVARTLLSLSWIGFGVVIPGVAAMTSAAAVSTLRSGALPTAVGVLAAVACVATFVLYWVPVWLLWVFVTGLVLLVRPKTVRAPSPPQPPLRDTHRTLTERSAP
jgi:hypothetical protein